MPLIDHFGILAPYYEMFIPPRKPEKLIELAGLPIHGPLLDAGGGTGRVSQALQGLAQPVIVADLSHKMLRQAVQEHGLKSVQSHTERLPFPVAYFERVIMVDALHHVCSQLETAGELWRVLRPGGRLIIEEPDVRTLTVKLVSLAEKLALMRSHFLEPPRIASLFSAWGARTRIEKDGYNAWVVVQK
jgi:ubiquinone/menaquinone biosynthesis C-methylase UbiE